MPEHGKVCWNELMTRDVEGSKAYYSDLCGWTWQTMPMSEGDYHVAMKGEEMVAGCMDMAGMEHLENIPAHWFTYIEVDDVDKVAEQQAAKGGTIMRPAFDVEGVGRILLVQDPGGAALGFMQSSS